jgi:hypothetical protein
MINSKHSKERLIKAISDCIAGSPGSNGIGLSELSCILRMPFDKLIPYIENTIKDGLISIHSDDKSRVYKSAQKEIERQIKLLNSVFVCSDENNDLLILKDTQSIKISTNSRFIIDKSRTV